MNLILIAVISLGAIALVLAAILYVASKKFAVYEDPRIAQVGEVLPQANCGGCGYPGCSGFADACVKAGSLDGKFCPVGGQPVMAKIADILGLAAGEAEPMVAVVRCNGTCANRPRINQYDGAKSCAIAASLYGGETGCSYGCLGCGDCVAACPFDAIHLNPETGRPDTYLNGINVEKKIRTMEVSSRVSPIAALDFVREAMVAQQQEMGKAKGIVMDGRDIGTTVFPDAELKIFVTASPEIRAQRRYDELKAKGEEAGFDEILENVKQRDYIDQNREVSPLRKADDALLLDNSHMTISQQKEWLAEQFEKVCKS